MELSDPPRRPLLNFVILSVLFSANHGAMVSCLAFATLELGSVGAWQLCFFHLVYGASSLLGATFVVKQLGSRNSMAIGMSMYAAYVGCFWMALKWGSFVDTFAAIGAIFGGMGGGLVWTSQGAYFGRASQDYAIVSNIKSETATSYLAGVFAFIYLMGEVACKLLSWALLQSWHSQWSTVFAAYAAVAVASTALMFTVQNYPPAEDEEHRSIGYKMSAAWQLLRHDRKMPYMVGLNAVFGFAYPFVNSYVNGEVVHRVLTNDTNFKYVGLFSAITSAVAAVCSLAFGNVPSFIGKGPILIMGALSFATVALVFVVRPNLEYWRWELLAAVYALQGVGRATFEGALRATFADFFPGEREGAFANIILQNGIFTALGFGLSFAVTCSRTGPYCVEYKEGGLHNILVLELAVIVSAAFAILGYLKACILFKAEQEVAIFDNGDEMPYVRLVSDEVEENSDQLSLRISQ